MKFTVNKFTVGQVVTARVQESLDGGDIIATFKGDLLRVSNQTGRAFKKGALIELEVRSIKPLSFRLAEKRKSFGIRVSV